MTTSSAVLSILCGTLVGFALGLVGGGGSTLATPLLLYVVAVGSPHVAIGTGSVAVAAAALSNLATHARAGHVRWVSAAIFAVVGLRDLAQRDGAGARLSRGVPSSRLREKVAPRSGVGRGAFPSLPPMSPKRHDP